LRGRTTRSEKRDFGQFSVHCTQIASSTPPARAHGHSRAACCPLPASSCCQRGEASRRCRQYVWENRRSKLEQKIFQSLFRTWLLPAGYAACTRHRRHARASTLTPTPGERGTLWLTCSSVHLLGTVFTVPNGPKTVPKWVFGENRECKFPNSQSFARPAKRSRTHRPNFVRIKFRCRISNPPPTPPAVWLPRPDWNVNTCIRYAFPAFWCRAGTKTRTHGNRAHQTDLWRWSIKIR
jgi:hypothetical protein